MKIWIARHGQTELNRKKLMQGRTDAPLNEKGIAQARQSRKNIGDVHFDAVYASPLQRAILTGSIIGDVDPSEIIVDPIRASHDRLLDDAQDLSRAAHSGDH